MSHTPPTPESELVARLRERTITVFHPPAGTGSVGGYYDAAPDQDCVEATATIERLASAHEQGRREGIEMAANGCREIADELASAGGHPEAVAAVYRVYRRIRALSSAPPGEKGERIPSGWKLVPVAALEWLFGAQADDQGRWFDPKKFHNAKGTYWWRKVFRAMLAASHPPAKAEDGMREALEQLRELAAKVNGEGAASSGDYIDFFNEAERLLDRALAKEPTP